MLYRQSIGIVTQDPVLLSGTIISNLTYGCKENVSKEDVVKAAKLANAHEFIQSFPEQYDTQVGERGVQLSGGQKQVRNHTYFLFVTYLTIFCIH